MEAQYAIPKNVITTMRNCTYNHAAIMGLPLFKFVALYWYSTKKMPMEKLAQNILDNRFGHDIIVV
jgi:hypothetical protein